MTKLLLVILLFAASAFDAANCQVEYQHFEGFSVISEPSPIPEAKSKEPVRGEDILILSDTNPRETSDDKPTCLFVDTNASLTWETADGMPVMYVYKKCGRTLVMSYRDLSGREWRESQLVPLESETFSETLSKLDSVGPGNDEKAQIAGYAICKGIVPKPDWFNAICDQQAQKTSH